MSNKKLLFDKIILLIVSYIFFVVISIVVIFSMDNYMHKRMMFLGGLLQNENAKVRLNDIMKSKIAESRGLLMSYVNATSFNEMDMYEKDIAGKVKDMSGILYILENGGNYRDTYDVSFDGMNKYTENIVYKNYSASRFNVQVMDLRAKLKEITSYTGILRSLGIDRIIAINSGSFVRVAGVSKKITQEMKSVAAFYHRMGENSNRLFVEADRSEKSIDEYIHNTSKRFRILKIRVNFIIGVILTLAGIFIFFNIYRTVRSRREFSEELNSLNTSLEETVLKRTKELESEVLIRQQKEHDSQIKAQFLMDVIESLAHPFYVIDAQTYEIILANNAAYEVIGRQGRTCYELTHRSNEPCSGIEHPCPLKQVLETGVPTTVEHMHIVRNGEKRYFEVHGYPVKDEDGNVIQMIEYSLDITEKKDAEFTLINLNSMLEERVAERTRKLEQEVANRKLAEQQVKVRENHFRHLIANISDIIAILDESMRITYLSPSIEPITGFTQGQLLGKSFEDLIHSRDRELFRIWMDKVMDGTEEHRVIEFRLQKRSGQWINGEAIAKNLLDSDVIRGVVINVRDITIRKKAEDEIRKLALVMEQNPNSIVVTDTDANIEYVNPAFEKITGYRVSEVIGKNPNVLKTEHTPPETFVELWKTIKSGKVWNGEFVNKKKNGELYNEHAIIAPIMNDRGEIVNFLGMKENITELKKAREKAEETSKAKSMFLANMSHEIRTPLNGLMGFLDLLGQTALNGEQKEYVSTIKFSADTLLSVLNDVLDLSKIESGMLELEDREIDLSYNLMQTAKTFYAKATEKGIRMYTYIDPQIPQILLGDSLRLNQVMNNLLGNAVKFTDEGGTVRASAELVKDTGKYSTVSFVVEDTGVGIPADKLDTIFESFAQVDTTITRRYGGTGLGLTISKNLLKLMGSDIRVESEDGEGSRFIFEIKFRKVSRGTDKLRMYQKVFIYGDGSPEMYEQLEKYLSSLKADYTYIKSAEEAGDPAGAVFIMNDISRDFDLAENLIDKGARVVCITDDIAGKVSTPASDSFVKLRRPYNGILFYEALTGEYISDRNMFRADKDTGRFSGHVLVAEDNPVNIKLMEAMLNRLGVDTEMVENGTDAVEIACQNRFDVIFMDINMPGMDGATATRKIREYESSFYKNRTPVIALTAHSISELSSEFMDSDFDGYLKKPVVMDDMESVLGKYLPDDYEQENSEAVFDLQNIVEEIGLPEETVCSLLNSYAKSTLEDIEKLKSMTLAGDYNAVSGIIQSDMSASENLRLVTVTAVFNDMEKSVRLKNNDDIINIISRLKSELNFILDILGDKI